MADITIVTTSVSPASTATLVHGLANGAVGAGTILYFDDTVTGRWKTVSAATSANYVGKRIGMLVNTTTAANQPCTVAIAGDITVGAVLTTGVVYVIGSASSKIAPAADLVSTWYVTTIGIAISTSVLRLMINRTDTVKP